MRINIRATFDLIDEEPIETEVLWDCEDAVMEILKEHGYVAEAIAREEV